MVDKKYGIRKKVNKVVFRGKSNSSSSQTREVPIRLNSEGWPGAIYRIATKQSQ
jgi:hypothetical protein